MKKIILFLLFFSLGASSQVTLSTVYQTSDSQINLYIVSQGFTSGSMTDFDNYVSGFLSFMWSQEPYTTMQSRFRVITAKVPAVTEHVPGASFLFNNLDPSSELPYFICDTIGNPEYNQYLAGECGDDFRTRMENLIPYLTGYNSKSYILAVFNNNYYTARGGEYAFTTSFCNDPFMYKVLLHEFGHTFGLLADEYGITSTLPYQQDEFCNIIYEDGDPLYLSPDNFPLFHDRNVTSKTVLSEIPWNYLILPATPFPTCNTAGSLPSCSNYTDIGAFEGANYTNSAWFRPKHTCGMRDLNDPFSFCQVCQDLITERIQEHLCYANNTVTENFTSRHQYITHWRKATTMLSSNSTIGTSISVNYISGNSITLTNGFNAKSGSDFRGYIGDCSLINLQNTYRASHEETNQNSNTQKGNAFNNQTTSFQNNLIATPNPTSNHLTITLENTLIHKIILTSIDGKTISIKENVNESTYELNTTACKNGIYILTVESVEGKIYTEKIIKH